MTLRLRALPVAVVAVAAVLFLFAAQRADSASYLGSPDTSAAPDAFACAACPPATSIGFRQFALRGTLVEAPEQGVLVSASVNAKLTAGSE